MVFEYCGVIRYILWMICSFFSTLRLLAQLFPEACFLLLIGVRNT